MCKKLPLKLTIYDIAHATLAASASSWVPSVYNNYTKLNGLVF